MQGAVDEGVVILVLRPHQMRGQGDFAGTQRPDMQVVDGLHAGQAGQEGLDLGLVDAGGNRIHGGVEAVPEQAEGADRDYHANQQRGRRIQPGPAEGEHAEAGNHRRQRNRRVCDQMQEGAALVQVVGVPVLNQPSGPQVDGDADRGHHDHRGGGNLRRGTEAADRFPAQGAGEHHQQDRVGQRRQQGGTSPAVGVAAGGRAARQRRGRPGQAQAEHVAQVVQGVRQQRQRVGVEAVTCFKRGVGQVDQRDQREGPGGRTVRVGVRAV